MAAVPGNGEKGDTTLGAGGTILDPGGIMVDPGGTRRRWDPEGRVAVGNGVLDRTEGGGKEERRNEPSVLRHDPDRVQPTTEQQGRREPDFAKQPPAAAEQQERDLRRAEASLLFLKKGWIGMHSN